MTVTDLKWNTRDDGATWALSGDYKGMDAAGVLRRLFEIQYLGRGRGGGPLRWKVYDKRYWVEVQEGREFSNLDEAKAWAEAIVRLDP